MAPNNPSRDAVQAVVAVEGMSEAPSQTLVALLSSYRWSLESFIASEESLPKTADAEAQRAVERDWYAAHAALRLLTVLQERFTEFQPGFGQPVDDRIFRTAESFGAVSFQNLHEFLEGHVVPLSLLVRSSFSRWFADRAEVVPTTKEMMYGRKQWGPARIALDASANHLDASRHFSIEFVLAPTSPRTEPLVQDIATMRSAPYAGSILEVRISDAGSGYPSAETARERPTKGRGSIGEHGEGLLMAALAATRLGIGIMYGSRQWEEDAVGFPQPDDAEDPNTDHGWYLSYILRHMSSARQGSCTVFRRPTQDMVNELFKLKDNLLRYIPHTVVGVCDREDTESGGRVSYGRVLALSLQDRRSPKNRFFIKGVDANHEEPSPLLFSYDFDVETPRDRNEVPNVNAHLLKIWKEACTPVMANAMIQAAMVDDPGWSMSRQDFVHGAEQVRFKEHREILPMLEANSSALVRDTFRECFIAMHGRNAVVATQSEATRRFEQQQATVTKGRTLVRVGKNMATFLRNACGLPLDWDVVQFPQEKSRGTSLTLEAVRTRQDGVSGAFEDVLLMLHQVSGNGPVTLQFECTGMDELVSLQELRSTPHLQHRVIKVYMNSSGGTIEEGAVVLELGEAQDPTEAIHRLPSALARLLDEGVRPQITSGTWTAVPKVEEEVVGNATATGVAYEVERFPAYTMEGVRIVLDSLEPDSPLAHETVTRLLEKVQDGCFVVGHPWGEPLAVFPDGMQILASGEQGEGLFVGGQRLFRLGSGRYSFNLPVNALTPSMTGGTDPFSSEARFRVTHRNRLRADTTTELPLREFLRVRCAIAFAEGLPDAERVACVRSMLRRVDTAVEVTSYDDASAETNLLGDYHQYRRAGYRIENESPEACATFAQQQWGAAVDQVLAEWGLARASTVLQNPRSPRFRMVVRTVSEGVRGGRTEFSKSDQWENAVNHHRNAVVALHGEGDVVQGAAEFLQASGVTLDTALPMLLIPFNEKYPWVAPTLRRALLTCGLLLAAWAGGKGILSMLEPEETPVAVTAPPSSGGGPSEGGEIRTPEQGLEGQRLLEFLKALLLGGAVLGAGYGGVRTVVGVGRFGLRMMDAWEQAREDAERQRILDQREEARRGRQKAWAQHIVTQLGFLDEIFGLEYFACLQIQWTQEYIGGASLFSREQNAIFLNQDHVPDDPFATAVETLTNQVLPQMLADIPADRKPAVLEAILTGTFRKVLCAQRKGTDSNVVTRELSLDQLKSAWAPTRRTE